MENAVQEEAITVVADGSITFANDVVRTGSANCCGWLEHETGSSQFTLLRNGVYEVQFSTNVTSADTGVTELAITSNGETILGATMQYNVATANVYGNVSTNRLIRVCGNSSKTLTIKNISDIDVLVENASLIIKKIA